MPGECYSFSPFHPPSWSQILTSSALADRLRISDLGQLKLGRGIARVVRRNSGAGLTDAQLLRNSLSRLWPMQLSDHSPLTFVALVQSWQQELSETTSVLGWAEYRFHRLHMPGVTLASPFGLQLAAHPIPGRQMLGRASSGRWRRHPTVKSNLFGAPARAGDSDFRRPDFPPVGYAFRSRT